MLLSDALLRSPISDPPEANGVYEAEEATEKMFVRAIIFLNRTSRLGQSPTLSYKTKTPAGDQMYLVT